MQSEGMINILSQAYFQETTFRFSYIFFAMEKHKKAYSEIVLCL